MQNLRKHIKLICVSAMVLIASNAHSQNISDKEIKKNISPISSPLQSISQLEPMVYEFDTDRFKAFKFRHGLQYGFLADNIQSVFPGMVGSRSVSYMVGKNTYRDSRIATIDYESLVPVLVASVKELHLEIEKLKLEIQQLKK